MPRKPQVRYFTSRGAYYCQLNGTQHKLAVGPDDGPTGPTFQAAAKAYGDLMSLANVESAKDRSPCQAVLEKYLTWIETRRKRGTYELRQAAFQAFIERLGEVPVNKLTYGMVEAWLDEMRRKRPASAGRDGCAKWESSWGDGSCRNAIDSLHAAFNWAAKPGNDLITKNPIKGIDVPRPRSRGRHAILANDRPEQLRLHRAILAASSEAFRPFIIALENTGARPGELAAATAKDWHDDLASLIFYPDDGRLDPESFSHKTGSKGRDRVIRFTGAALAMVRGLVAEHPTGPLFRTYAGNPWSRTQFAKRFRVLRAKIGLPALTAYTYRHTFATNWLKAGRPIDILAELLGNTPNIIRKHYSHLCGDHKGIRAQLEAFATEVGEDEHTEAPGRSASDRDGEQPRPEESE